MIFLFLGNTFLHAQLPQECRQPAAAGELEVQRQELVTLEKEVAHAVMLHNGTFVRRVFSDDYHGALATGEIVDRLSYSNFVQNSRSAYTTFIVTDIQVRIYESTAIVTATWTARGAENGHPFARQYRLMHAYFNGVAGWKLIAGQETMLPG